MRNVYLISDPHFGHKNILDFANRPFSSIEEMEEELVDRWNRRVSSKDTVICLGDWGFGVQNYKVAERLNGIKRIVLGNHDNGKMNHYYNRFASVHGSLQKKGLLFTHIPILFDKYRNYEFVVHGHIHRAEDNVQDLRYINVNMDAWDYVEGEEYSPIPIEDVEILARERLELMKLNIIQGRPMYEPQEKI